MAPARNYSRSGRLATPTLPDAHIGEDSRGAKGFCTVQKSCSTVPHPVARPLLAALQSGRSQMKYIWSPGAVHRLSTLFLGVVRQWCASGCASGVLLRQVI